MVNTGSRPRRSDFTTTDQAEARDFLERNYGGRLRIAATGTTDWRLRARQLAAGPFTLNDVVLPAELRFDITGRDEVIVETVVAGAVGVDHDKISDRFGPGDVLIANSPHSQAQAISREAHLLAVVLPRALLTDVAGADPAVGDFTSRQPSPGGAARWREVTRLVGELLAGPGSASALLVGPAARLLAATALTVFPNTITESAPPADHIGTQPATLRRAMAFIEAECDRDISLADVARAAGTTPRAVRLLFREHLDVTPMSYLRRVRLALAHRGLRDAAPDNGTTVDAVAVRWGFAPSRFTEHYQAVYGVPPDATLRS